MDDYAVRHLESLEDLELMWSLIAEPWQPARFRLRRAVLDYLNRERNRVIAPLDSRHRKAIAVDSRFRILFKRFASLSNFAELAAFHSAVVC